MKKLLLGLGALLISSTLLAGDRTGVGIAVGAYDGLYKGTSAKDYPNPMPLLDVNYGNIYIKGLTVGYEMYKDDVFTTSLFMNPFGGYKVDGKDLSTGYDKIDDRDFQIMFGARVDIDPNINNFRIGLLGQAGKEGAEFKASVYRPMHINEKLILVPSIHFSGYSSDYADYYFGVSADEATRSKELTEYKADATFSYGANLTAEYGLTDNIALLAFLGIEKFDKEIANSPIIEDDFLYFVGFGAKYYF